MVPPRGGFRKGSGRPVSAPTKVIRVPLRLLPVIEKLQQEELGIPLYSSKVQAGFPSPTDDYIEKYLDLNTQFIKHPSSTFVLQAMGDSMKEAGISSGDWLLVDRSIEPVDGKIVIAAVNGELTVKRLSRHNNSVVLLPANPAYEPIIIHENFELVIWGVVILVIHEL